MIIEPFKPEHVRLIDVQDVQRVELIGYDNPEYLASIAAHPSWSGIIDGDVVCCAGYFPIWCGRYYAWALLSRRLKPHDMIALTRSVRRGLDLIADARCEAVVQSDFDTGHRWLRMLGFTRETPEPMRRYFPHGGNAVLYSRVK